MGVEDREFEELAKAMANGQSRRRIVKAIAGSALAGAAGLFTRSRTTVAAATTTTTKRPTTTTTTTTTKRPTTTTTTTTTKRPTTTTTTTTTKRPNGTTPPPVCLHSEGPNGGCKGACTSAGFTGRQCNVICGNGQFEGYCPVGQGGGNPCCNPGLCNPANFEEGPDGDPVYTGSLSGCSARQRRISRS